MVKEISSLTKTPVLILFVGLAAIGISAVSAVTITLSGTTIVNGTMTALDYFDTKNTQTGVNATALGGNNNTASGDLSTVGGGESNTASGFSSVVGGGGDADLGNLASGNYSTIAGGFDNTASGFRSFIGGGDGNVASGFASFIGGGRNNDASHNLATVGGGTGNEAKGPGSTVGGGFVNTASGQESTIGGGFINTASGSNSTVPGGAFNEASGNYSFAAGHKAKAIHDGSFVWADSTNADFTSTAADQFAIRASGGIIMNVSGATVVVDGATVHTSDGRLKENIHEYTVLDKLGNFRAVEFDWKKNGNHEVGIIAQELVQIFPDLVVGVDTDNDSYILAAQYNKLGALALQAIKEQQVQIEEQQNLIDSLIDITCADDKELEICKEN